MGSRGDVPPKRKELACELHQLASLGVRLTDSGNAGVTVHNPTVLSLYMKVKRRQYEDPKLSYYRDTLPQKEKSPFEISAGGILRYRSRLCVPDVARLRRQILEEAHYSRYSVHPVAIKMYHDLKLMYCWEEMKRDIAEFVAQYPNCQQVKIEHQKPAGLLQAMKIPTWKLTKSAHFLPVRSTYSVEDYARLYLKEIVRLHGIPVSIITDI
ncbi:uncharacterized protein LOC132054137 [Lycium ferocissimum]|uniref:uncharacterized protein LOC132054137 n=1 Tax=Lycium ferocissimum TaxID=112874 RepID=UPI0028149C10|nr:uncharacterized protein LOC132054137 [Lycium ferocissimum]